MKILHILNHVKAVGNGIVNVAVDLACLQSKAGHDVGIVSVGGDYEALLASHKVQHFPLNQSRTPVNLLLALKRYQTIIEDFQPDVVHAHMMTGITIAKIWKGVVTYALVSTVHNEFQRSAVLMGWADRVIAVSQAVAQSMAKRGVASHKLRVIANGTLGSPRTRAIEEYEPITLQHPAIATVAGMYCRKGISELIDAFVQIAVQMPDIHLYLVGHGPDKGVFEAQAQVTSVADRIHFEGFQPEPQRYLLAADIFVLASHQDPSPLVIPEAREAGCAIVATHVDGIPEALDAGQAGVLVPPENSTALAIALRQLLEQPEVLQKWREQAKQNLDRLKVSRVCEETLKVYQELL